MKLTKISLHKLGPFEDLEIAVQECTDPKRADVHVFVGENGTGKSTILRAIAACFGVGSIDSAAAHDEESWASVETSLDGIAVFPLRGRSQMDELNDTFRGWTPLVDHSGPGQSLSKSQGELARIRRDHVIAAQGRSEASVASPVFAYLTPRGFATRSPRGVQEMQSNPLSSTAVDGFMHWVMNEEAERVFASAEDDVAQATAAADSLTKIAEVLSDLFGRVITFKFERRPFQAILLVDGSHIDSSVLPAGMISVLSWLTDLFVRLNRIKWSHPGPALRQPFTLLLDEVDHHLHPAWQRKILAVVQDLFPNAQVFVSTHSPFVVSSVSDAWIYPLRLNGTRAELGTPIQSQVGSSYSTVLHDVLGIESEFSIEAERLLTEFRSARTRRLAGDESAQVDLERIAAQLSRWTETRTIVAQELRQIERVLKTAVA